MGQAAVDLPDPMQSPAAPATAGTDDLLAQLAGDEIERLLAETETERPAAPAPSAIPEIVNAPAAPSTMSPIAASPASPAMPAADQTVAAADLNSELDALFDTLTETPPAPAAVAPTAPPTPSPAAPAAPAEEPAPSPAEDDIESTAAERQALSAPIPAAASTEQADIAAVSHTIAEAIHPAIEEDARPSLLVRLLEIINSPLGNCSDSMRQAVGKIAIATLLNAIAVLVYTLVIRHR